MKAQLIGKNSKPAFAVIPYTEYKHFLELLDDEADARAIAEFHDAYHAGREFLIAREIMEKWGQVLQPRNYPPVIMRDPIFCISLYKEGRWWVYETGRK